MAEPSYVSGARLALPAVLARTDLLRKQAEGESARQALLKDVGLADANADLEWTREQARMAAADRALQTQLAQRDHALRMERIAAERENQRRSQAAQIARNAAALAAARSKLEAAGRIKPETPFDLKTGKGKSSLGLKERRVLIDTVGAAKNYKDALGHIEAAKRQGIFSSRESAAFGADPDEIKRVLRKVYTEDGRVKDSFVAWAGEAGERYHNIWLNQSATADRLKQSRIAEENQDGLGAIANAASRFGGGVLEVLDRAFKAFPTGVNEAARAGRTERSFMDLSTVNDFLRGAGRSLSGQGERLQMSEVLDPARGNLTGLGEATMSNKTSRAIFGGASDMLLDPINLVPGGFLTKPARGLGRAAGLPQLVDAIGQTGVGQTLRKGTVPFASTRDFMRARLDGDKGLAREFSDDAVGAGHRQMAGVNAAQESVDLRLAPFATVRQRVAADPDTAARLRDALDTDNVDMFAREAVDAGDEELAGLAKTLDSMRRESFQNLRQAGLKAWEDLSPEALEMGAKADLRDWRTYVGRVFTNEGREALGLPALDALPRRGAASKTGTMKRRRGDLIKEGQFAGRTLDELTAAELVEQLGIDGALLMDPVNIIAHSLKASQDVLGRSNLADALEESAEKLGAKGVVWRAGDSKKKPHGYEKIAPDAYIPRELAEDVTNLQKAGTHIAALRGYDTFLNGLRGLTLLNPVAMVPYISRNIYTATLVNVLRGVNDPRYYQTGLKLHRALDQAVEAAGGQGGEAAIRRRLAKSDLTPEQVDAAMALRAENIYQPGRGFQGRLEETTIGRDQPGLGTRLGAKLNKPAEEVPRGAMFLHALDQGLSPAEAAKRVRFNHFDYTALGKTRMERDIMSRLSFFYTFATRSPRVFAGAALSNPKVAAGMTKLGLGPTDPDEMTEFGDPKGYFVESPLQGLSALPHELSELTKDFGGDPAESQMSNPVLSTLFGSKGIFGGADAETKVRNLVPPLDRVMREGERMAAGGEERKRGLIGFTGVKFGKDTNDPDKYRDPAKVDWAKESSDSLKIEAKRLGITGYSKMKRPELVDAVVAAGGEQAPAPGRTRKALEAAARMLNVPSESTRLMEDDELRSALESLGGEPLPVLPEKGQINAIAKLHGLKGYSKLGTEELLSILAGTPELEKLMATINRPGYLSGKRTQDAFSKAAEREALLSSPTVLSLLGR